MFWRIPPTFYTKTVNIDVNIDDFNEQETLGQFAAIAYYERAVAEIMNDNDQKIKKDDDTHWLFNLFESM